MSRLLSCLFFFFFNDTATTEIYTLSLHDALPISAGCATIQVAATLGVPVGVAADFMVPDLPAAAEIILGELERRRETRAGSQGRAPKPKGTAAALARGADNAIEL